MAILLTNNDDSHGCTGARENRASRLSFASFRLSDIESTTDPDFGTVGGRRLNNRQSEEDDENVLREKNYRTVKCAKRILFVILLASAAIATFLTYTFSKQQRQRGFEDAFWDLGSTITSKVDLSVGGILSLAESLAISYQYSAEQQQQQAASAWPNATLREFLSRTNGLEYNGVAFLPYLEDQQIRALWEQYAVENQEYVLSDAGVYMLPTYGNASRTLRAETDISKERLKNMNASALMEATVSDTAETTRLLQTSAQLNGGRTIEDGIFALEGGVAVDDTSSPPYWPIWQVSPLATNDDSIMYNQYSNWFGKPAIALRALSTLGEPTMSQIIFGESAFKEYKNDDPNRPRILLYYPIFDADARLVGAINVDFDVEGLLSGALPDTSDDVLDVTISNSCGQRFSYQVEGPTATFVEDDLYRSLPDSDFIVEQVWNHTRATCVFTTSVFPSKELQDHHIGTRPIVYTAIVLSMFFFCCLVFFIYSCVVEHRQDQLLRSATQTNAIVQNLFPRNVRERMFREARNRAAAKETARHRSLLHVPYTPKIRLKNFLADNNSQAESCDEASNLARNIDGMSEPIADLFPHTTVLFADIAGFTAWSSEREPSQVFILLESLYRKFDEVSHKLGVFKVETIGDCYVAVTGLPDPVPDHAVLCARFAFEILYHMRELTKQLEGSLGPGTSDLALRIGLHSGPVTAGVLRGEKSRFQLFGDTMNTASRIESCGYPDRVHCSEYTANLIESSGKEHWLTKRHDLVTAKGKGEMQTYWLKPRRFDHSNGKSSSIGYGDSTEVTVQNTITNNNHTHTESQVHDEPINEATNISNGGSRIARRLSAGFGRWGSVAMPFDSVSEPPNNSVDVDKNSAKKTRLVKWNVDVLLPLLAKIVSSRRKSLKASLAATMEQSVISSSSLKNGDAKGSQFKALEEVTEIIGFPVFDPRTTMTDASAQSLLLDETVKAQLREYVAQVAALYRDNPFHNFEHASHVTMSANKLLKRIIHPDDLDYNLEGAENKSSKYQCLMKELHTSTYGISSDPLTQFAIVFSALIHDADHSGLPNVQLVAEKAEVALKFNNKSVAEQNSLILAWELLMESQYDALRSCIWSSKAEKQRFRQLLVNSVMATDILDKDQQTIRKKRWDKAFMEPEDNSRNANMNGDLDLNRKATAVLEHIIQASDVAHTMQHWRIYCKWNERYFREKYFAWMNGRADADPSIGWFEGEIGFYDYYIIPLARKLKESGVFGVSSDEYLQYALENRQEWELKGRQVCEVMLEDAKYEWEAIQRESATEWKEEPC